METLSRLPKRPHLIAALGMVFALACRAASSRFMPAPVPTATPEVLADCFWSAQAFAWIDSDGDGTRDEGEQPLEGVEVNFSLTFFSGETTGADGVAHVAGMHPGACDATLENSVVAKAPEGYEPTTELVVAYTEGRDLYEFGFIPNP
jgi:hypothetical protein